MKREEPSVHLLLLGCFPGRDFGAFGQAFEEGFVLYVLLPGIGRIKHVLGELLGNLGKFGGQFLELRSFVFREIGARFHEIRHQFVEQPLFLTFEGLRFFGLSEGLDLFPKGLVEQSLGSKGGYFGEHFVVGFAQFLRITDLIEVGNQVPGFPQILLSFAEPQGDVPEINFFRRQAADGLYFGFSFFQRERHVGHDPLGRELGPGNVKRIVKKRIHEDDVGLGWMIN